MTENKMNAGQRIGLVVSLTISLGIVAYLFAKIDWPEVWNQLKTVNIVYIVALAAAFYPMLWMRAMRWRLILPNRNMLSTVRLMDATAIGYFASFVLPLRAGEIIRPYVASRWQPVSFSSAFASIMIERLSDSVCLLTLMLVCLSQLSEVPIVILAGVKALGLLTLILVVIVAASYVLPGKMESFFHWFSDRILGCFAPHASEKVNHMISEYFRGLRVITSFWQLAKVLLWSMAIWLMMAVWYQGLLWAFGVFPSFWVGMMLNVMIALAVAAPSAPGFIGVFQVGCILALHTVYGFSKEFAVAYSVIGHLIQMAFCVGIGLLVLHLRGLKFRQLRQTATSPD